MLSWGVRLLVSIAVLAASGTEVAGQGCQSAATRASLDESRRQAAVEFVVAVNSAQARWQRDTGRYGTLHELRQPPAPFGFVPRLIVGQFGYALKLADALGPCGFALFSDEHGVVYEGNPMSIPATARLTSANEGTADERDVP
jgi:hypothetical protein